MDKRDLINKLENRGYILITDDVYNISQRISRYDKKLLLFFNPYCQRYEVHTSAYFPTYCVSCEKLDSRLLKKLREADSRTEYGFREKMDMLEKQEEKVEKEKQTNYEMLKKDVIRQFEKYN